MISSLIEDLFYKLYLYSYMESITILWESELITLLPTHTNLAQYCPTRSTHRNSVFCVIEGNGAAP